MGKHLIKSYFNLGIEFLNCDCIDMTRLTPIIQINQGNTRSATVKPGKILYGYDQAHSYYPDKPGEYQISYG